MNAGLRMTLLNNKVKEGQEYRNREPERGMHYPMPWPPYGGEPDMRYDRDGEHMPPESRRYRDERGRYTSRPMRRRSEYDDGMSMRYDGENGTESRRIGFKREPWEEHGRERERRTRSEYGGKIIPMRRYAEEEDEDDEEDPRKNYKKPQRVRAGGTFWMDSPPDTQELTKENARAWVASMRGSDPAKPKGGKWSMEDVKPYAQRMGMPTDGVEFFEFFAIMNAMYSDYFEVAKKYNLQNNPAFFADMAKAWLHDEDAVDNKAAMYYDCIVKHD